MAEFEPGQKYSVSEDAVLGSLVVKNGPTQLPYLPDGVLEVVGGVVASTTDPSLLANFGNVIYQPGNGSPPNTIAGNIYNTWSDVVTVADQLNVSGALTIWLDFTYSVNIGGYQTIHIGGVSGPGLIFKMISKGAGGGGPPRALFDPGFAGTPTEFLTDLCELDGPFILEVHGNQNVATMLFSGVHNNHVMIKNGATLSFKYAIGTVPIGFIGAGIAFDIINSGLGYDGDFYGPTDFAAYGGVGIVLQGGLGPVILLPDSTFCVFNLVGGGWVGDVNGNGFVTGASAGGATVYVVHDSMVDPVQFTNPQFIVTAANPPNVNIQPIQMTAELYQNLSSTLSSLSPPINSGSSSYRVRDLLNYLATPMTVNMGMTGGQAVLIPNSTTTFAISMGTWNVDYNEMANVFPGQGPAIELSNSLFPCTLRLQYQLAFSTGNIWAPGDNLQCLVLGWDTSNQAGTQIGYAQTRTEMFTTTVAGDGDVCGSADIYFPATGGSNRRFELLINNNSGTDTHLTAIVPGQLYSVRPQFSITVVK